MTSFDFQSFLNSPSPNVQYQVVQPGCHAVSSLACKMEKQNEVQFFFQNIFVQVSFVLHIFIHSQHICKPGCSHIITCKHVPSINLMAMPCSKIQLQKGHLSGTCPRACMDNVWRLQKTRVCESRHM